MSCYVMLCCVMLCYACLTSPIFVNNLHDYVSQIYFLTTDTVSIFNSIFCFSRLTYHGVSKLVNLVKLHEHKFTENKKLFHENLKRDFLYDYIDNYQNYYSVN